MCNFLYFQTKATTADEATELNVRVSICVSVCVCLLLLCVCACCEGDWLATWKKKGRKQTND